MQYWYLMTEVPNSPWVTIADRKTVVFGFGAVEIFDGRRAECPMGYHCRRKKYEFTDAEKSRASETSSRPPRIRKRVLGKRKQIRKYPRYGGRGTLAPKSPDSPAVYPETTAHAHHRWLRITDYGFSPICYVIQSPFSRLTRADGRRSQWVKFDLFTCHGSDMNFSDWSNCYANELVLQKSLPKPRIRSAVIGCSRRQ